jgi:DNA-binding NarL/FixJ family response regulator
MQLPAQRKPGYSAPPAGVNPGARIPAPRMGGAVGTGGTDGSPAPTSTVAPAGQAAPAGDGISVAARARAAHPALQVIVLAVDDDPGRVVQALQAGAGAWVAKESSLGRLMSVIRGVLRDETHIPPLLLTGVIKELTAGRRDRTESERLVESLTPREKQVLGCMVAGLGRQAVADRLFLSPHTVRTHMQNVLGKLGVHSTLAAVALARRAGVGPAD